MPWGAIAAVAGSLIGGQSSKRADRSSKQGEERALQYHAAGLEDAKRAAIPLFDASQRNALAGFQGALDIQGQFAPEQVRTFQQGNLQAQDTMRAGLDPQIAAILGGQVDLSGLQTQQVQAPDPSMFQQQLPDFMSLSEAIPDIASQYIPKDMAIAQEALEQQMALQAQYQPRGYTGDDAWKNAQRPGFFAPGGYAMPWMQDAQPPNTAGSQGGTPIPTGISGPPMLGGL